MKQSLQLCASIESHSYISKINSVVDDNSYLFSYDSEQENEPELSSTGAKIDDKADLDSGNSMVVGCHRESAEIEDSALSRQLP